MILSLIPLAIQEPHGSNLHFRPLDSLVNDLKAILSGFCFAQLETAVKIDENSCRGVFCFIKLA